MTMYIYTHIYTHTSLYMTNEQLNGLSTLKYIFLILSLMLSPQNYGLKTGKLSNQVLASN